MKTAAVVAAIASWFFANTWRGLTVHFNPDDMMNLYDAWHLPKLHLLMANLTPFNKVHRPFGAAIYRGLFDLFGLHPLPFRMFVFALLLTNIGLLYWLAKLITESTEISILAALIGAYHNRVMDVYIYGGTVYDVLCGFFFTLAACVYIRARRGGSALGWRSFALFVALNVLALNSKEMAVTLPVVLLAYEILYHRPFSFVKSLPLWCSLAMGAIMAKIKSGPGTPFYGNPEYKLDLSVHQFFLTSRQFLDELFVLRAGTMSTASVAGVFAVVIAIALLSRRRDLRLGAAMILLMPLPVSFIPYRGFFVMYLPMIGWAIYIAICAVALRDWLLDRIWHRPALPNGTWEPERVALFLFTLFVLFNIHTRDTLRSITDVNPAVERVGMLVDSLERMRVAIPQSARVLFLKSDFLEDERWTPLYIVRLYGRSPEVPVDVRDEGRAYTLKLTRCATGYCVAQ